MKSGTWYAKIWIRLRKSGAHFLKKKLNFAVKRVKFNSKEYIQFTNHLKTFLNDLILPNV